jgi:hypothetical protein
MIQAEAGGAVDIYHNGSSKFATTATGAQINGQLNLENADGAIVTGVKATRFGYSSSYRVTQVGDTSGNNSVSIAYDPSTNSSGSFDGTGHEVLFRNGVEFMTPNSANTGFYNNLFVMKDGNIGIGTSSPGELLHLSLPSGISGDIMRLSRSASAYSFQLGVSSGATSNLYISDNANNKIIDFTSSGNVGIGTSSPSTDITKFGGSAKGLSVAAGQPVIAVRSTANSQYVGYFGQASTNTYLGAIGGGSLIMQTGTSGTERLRIDSNGNVGIGVVPETTYVQKTTLRLSSTASLIAGTSYYPYPYYIANNVYYDSSDNLKYIASSGGALLSVNAHTGGSFSFYTAPAGTAGATASLTERMRIDTSGKVKIASPSNNATPFNIRSISTSQYVADFSVKTNGYGIYLRNASETVVGTIIMNAGGTAYNTSSDYRLKENVVANWDATTRLKQLNPVRFNFIADADTTVDGFLAHEVQSVVPEAITGTHNEVDDDGNPVYQGIDQSKLVPLLVKTIQELEARITALETAE